MGEKLIVVTGNRGKTTLAYYLAQELSLRCRVALVSTNGVIPTHPVLFPIKRNSNALRSLGKLLSMPVVSQEDVFDNAIMLSKKLILFSYGSGESHQNYPAIIKENLEAVFSQLLLAADIVIVDTTTVQNDIDRYALSIPHTELCITTADLQGFCYRQFWKPQGIQIVWPSSRVSSTQDVTVSFEANPQLLPYCKSFEALYSGIDISEIVPDRKYTKEIKKIAGDLL